MALRLGNFQSPKKASNPSIQIPDEAPGFCRRFKDSSQTAQEGPIKLGKFLLLNLKRKAASRFIVEICGFDVSSQFFESADFSLTVKQTFY